MNYFTLHVRLTNKCQADCYYCSSWKEEPVSISSPDIFVKYLDFIWNNYIKKNNILFSSICIEYVGGEVLLIEPEKLKDIVNSGRLFFQNKGIEVIDGVQSNLVVSESRLRNAIEVFGDRIGTSVDDVSHSRTINGSNIQYKEVFDFNEAHILQKKAPAVFTVTKENLNKALLQLKICESENRNITFRHVFSGGLKTDLIEDEALGEFYRDLTKAYVCKSNIIVEPIHSLIKGRLQEKSSYDIRTCYTTCPFQNDCSRKSLSIDPNGDLYVCQEMSDTSQYRLGNANKEIIEQSNVAIVNQRQLRLPEECYTCKYFQSCKGGCMMESIQFGHGAHGKSDYCSSWKMLFGTIDELIDEYGVPNIVSWIFENEKK